MKDLRPWKVLDDCGNTLSAHSAEIDAIRAAGAHMMHRGQYVYIGKPATEDCSCVFCQSDAGEYICTPYQPLVLRECVSQISSSEEKHLRSITGEFGEV